MPRHSSTPYRNVGKSLKKGFIFFCTKNNVVTVPVNAGSPAKKIEALSVLDIDLYTLNLRHLPHHTETSNICPITDDSSRCPIKYNANAPPFTVSPQSLADNISTVSDGGGEFNKEACSTLHHRLVLSHNIRPITVSPTALVNTIDGVSNKNRDSHKAPIVRHGLVSVGINAFFDVYIVYLTTPASLPILPAALVYNIDRVSNRGR